MNDAVPFRQSAFARLGYGKFCKRFKQTGLGRGRSYRRAQACIKLSRLAGLSLGSAMIWYVDSKDGSDASDGRTMEAAFRTIGHAISVSLSGDTILLAPGTYEQNLPQKVSQARAANLTITVAGSD